MAVHHEHLITTAGLDLTLDYTTGEIAIGPGIAAEPVHVRTLHELRALLAGPDDSPDDRPCYLMYRDLRREADQELLAAHGLRYDITVTLPGRLGAELMKTAGHYHSRAPHTSLSYPEIYEVLSGEALFLLQRVQDPDAALADLVVEEVVLIHCLPGERLLIPPHYGHVTINAGMKPLVVADLIARASRNTYGAIRDAGGAAYYILAPGRIEQAQPNPRYSNVPPIQYANTPDEAGLGLRGPPLYTALCTHPEQFAYLVS